MKISKKYLRLKEDQERNYAADTSATNATPSEIVNQTKQEHSDANSVTIPGKEIDGNTNTQTSTMEINNDPASLANAQRMARTFQSQGQDVNFKVNLNNSVQRDGKLVESVQFSKGELSRFLRSL